MSDHTKNGKALSISDVYSLHLVLLSGKDEMRDLWLPKIPEGFFQFSDSSEHCFLNISAKNGQWIAVCKSPAFFKDMPLEYSYETPLTDGLLLKIDFESKIYTLFAEKVLRERMIFHTYAVPTDTEISVGSRPGCDILFDSPLVARKHAVLCRRSSQWTFSCCDNVYGAYVNAKRRDNANLKLGDVIYIMGLKIVIGTNFISINNCSGKVMVNRRVLQSETADPGGISHYYGQEQAESDQLCFSRAPRKRLALTAKSITVEGPPMSMSQRQMPLMLRMGSSMVTGGISALAGNFTTLLSSVLFPFLSSKYTDTQRQEYEKLRLTKYTEYLQKKRQEIANAIAEERTELNRKYPAISSIIAPGRMMTQLWERRPGDSDFLQLRIGTGTQPLITTIEYPERRFALESDVLEDKMYELVEKPYYVENAPVILSLTDTNICGISGPREQVIGFIRQMILQAAVFHSYDEVKMIFLLSESELALLDEIRYLPHSWDDQRTMRFVATNEAEAYTLGEYLKSQIIDCTDEEKDLYHILKNRPYYLIFALDKKLFDSHEAFKQILKYDSNPGVSIITAHDAPLKETQKIITLRSQQDNVCTTMSTDGGDDIRFALDALSSSDISNAMHTLANISLKQVVQAQTMPKMITFLEMFKTGRVEQLNPLKRWRENNPVKSLAAPVGVGEDGSLFTLDLHEKRQGPHGLVAGMTGSGKSEFIITYILSMAVNYHPDEVAFVLIDYKGGGLAGAFENPQTGVRLPHLVGTITNLDGASIQRSLMSIESELLRRQRIFNEIKSTVNEGTMDIYAYQKLYREGKVADPMPHLFIVSDEFAELKQQQPEFMDKLISAARIGRSLGVHLILATQKPSGVVNDQIRSNTKFRVCLRVQERSDSMDMLKRPEAAELTDTGRFYLQVGYNEYFAKGQSAWCGAAYEPQDTVAVRRDDEIEFLDTTGQVVTKAKPKVKKTDSGMKQIVAVVKYLSDLAAAHGIQARQLWQPELPKSLDLDTFSEKHRPLNKNPMSVCLGLLDDPEMMTQYPMTVDFSTCQNILIVGDSGSGKTVLVQNMLYSLSKQLSPQDFNFYILDYSSRMLKQFKSIPHCGAILQEEDENSLDEFFKLINSLVAERKRLFSELEVDSFADARKHRKIPLILVVIDNLTGLSASKMGEKHSYMLQTYLKNSAAYGIKYVVTCSRLNEAPTKLRQELGVRICLHLRDKYDYAEALGVKVSYIPPEVPGRGLYKVEDRPLEFQNTILCAGANDQKRTKHIKETMQTICSWYGTQAEARRMAVFSETATYEDFSSQFKRGRIPLGYSKQNGKPIALPLKQFSALSVYLGNPLGARVIMENMLCAATREGMDIWVVKRKENSVFDGDSGIRLPGNAGLYSLEATSLEKLRKMLFAQITERSTMLQEYCDNNGLEGEPGELNKKTFRYMHENTTPIMLIIENHADFCTSIDSISTLIFDKCFSKAGKLNIYVVSCFEPEDYNRIKKKTLYYGFNPEANILLLGGRFDKQNICDLPDTPGLDKELQYNLGLMCYQNRFHPILIPCGNLVTEEMDEDEQSIF